MVLILTSVILAASLSAAKLPIQNGRHGFQIQAQKSNSLELEYTVRDLDINKVATEKGEFTAIHMPNGYLTNKVGAPAEPEFHNLIELPLGSTPEVEVISYDSKTIDLTAAGYKAPLMPAQPSYEKCAKPEDIYTHYNPSSYTVDRFSDDQIATTTVSGNSRGRTIIKLSVRTTKYNPFTNKLTVLNNIKVRVKSKGGVANSQETIAAHYSPYFDDSYIINSTPKVEYNDLIKYPVTYLIVANNAIQTTPAMKAKLDEFIAWKTEKGFKVITNYVTAATNTTAAIDTWIENQYNTLTPKPSFLLLVGDMNGTYEVKTQTTGLLSGVSASDQLYGVIGAVSATNTIPSIHVGRFTVRSAEDLAAQVDKTIWYEKTQFTSNADLNYLKTAMVTAGHDGSFQESHGNPHVRYAMAYHFNDTFTNPTTGTTNGITGIGHLNGGTGQAANIVNTVSQGVAYYNYTAHGANDAFADPAFSIANVNSLANNGKYGLIIGNCCVTGSFADVECFGEAWLNAPNKGSIGFIGSSMNTTWNEDLAMGIGSEGAGQVAAGDVNGLPPAFTPNTPGMPDGLMLQKFPTQGSVRHVGLLAVETYGGAKAKYWQAYHLFGDPSVMIFAGLPKVMDVTHAPTIAPDATSFAVTAVKNAYVALSDNDGVLHGAGIANENGVATITITPFISGTAKLVVYAPMKKPVFETIPVAQLNGPYMTVNSYTVNNNTYGKNCTIDLRLKNIGNAASTNLSVTAVVDPTDAAFANVSSSAVSYGTVAAGDSVLKTAAITVAIAPNVPDQESIKLKLTMTDNVTKKTYEGTVYFVANAPVLSVSLSTGGTIMPGDNKNLVYKIKNSGHAAITTANVTLSQTTSLPITLSNAQQSAAAVNANDSVSFTFPAFFAASIPLGSQASLSLHLVAATSIDQSYTNNVAIGVTDILFSENFEGTWTPSGWINNGWVKFAGGGLNSSICAKVTYNPAGVKILTSKVIDLRNTTSDTLSFWWKDDDISKVAGHDTTYCEITANGTTWSTIGFLSAPSSESEYSKFSHALPAMYQTQYFQIRWRDKTDGDYAAYGTGVDDVMIRGYKPSSIEDIVQPQSTTLFQNYPNPFNPETTIKFFNKEAANVKLAIFNLKGEVVANLVNNNLSQGFHNCRFNATGLASGVYIYKLQIGSQSMVKSMLLLK